VTKPTPHRRQQRGTTLLEGLVAFLVLSLGMLSVVRVQTQLRLNSDVARQRSEAVRLAQEDLEQMRAFSVVGVRAGARAYSSLSSDTTIVDAIDGVSTNTRYSVAREVNNADAPNSKDASINVTWNDRTGAPQRVTLNTVISGSDPAYSGALTVIPRADPVRGVLARSPSIPIEAVNLGNGNSAIKPVAGGSEALVIDNASGRIVARCTGIDPARTNAQLQVADLRTCEPLQAVLLSGVVRFSSAEPPQPEAANDVPPALTVAVALSGSAGASASCTSEARKTVSYSVAGVTRTEGVPIAATAAALGASAWSESGERYAAYNCVVRPAVPGGTWSGRSNIAAVGWTIGTAPNDRRVCRYASDLDRSGAVDTNAEHPDAYAAVNASLMNQNFLVIKGSQSCPNSAAANGANGAVADFGTAPHQP
jgi:type IV pilus modification protein PilV